jgi:hypothetical protein
MGMMDKFEELAAQYLRHVLRGVRDGEHIPESEHRLQLQSALELFLPLMLRQADQTYWRLEAFDGFQFPVARKVGATEAEFRGAGLLLSAETWIPVQARLRVAGAGDTIAWGTCQAGDRRVGHGELASLLRSVSEHPESVQWAFSVEFPAASSQ